MLRSSSTSAIVRWTAGFWSLGGAGAAVWVALIGGLWFVSGGGGMGFGDVKLSPVLGACLGWVAVTSALVGLLAAFVAGAAAGIALLVAGRAGRRSQMPFGPFLLLGTLVGLLAGESIAGAYVSLLTG